MQERAKNMRANVLPQKDNPFLAFDHDPEKLDMLRMATFISRQIAEGIMSSQILDLYLRQDVVINFLTSAYEQLSGKTPYEIIKKGVDDSKQPIHGWNQNFDTPVGTRKIVREKRQVSRLPVDTVAVHLVNQPLINIKSIEKIVKRCPGIKFIQVPPSFARLVYPNLKREMSKRGIVLRMGRVDKAKNW